MQIVRVRAASRRQVDLNTSDAEAAETVAELVERTDLGTRTAAAAVAQYLSDARLYRGADFALSEQTLSSALQFAAARAPRMSLRKAA